MQHVLQDWMGRLAFWRGCGSVTAVVGAQASLWELTFHRVEGAPAELADLQRFARDLVDLVEEAELQVLFAPALFRSSGVLLGDGLERLGDPAHGELMLRRRGDPTPVDAAHAIQVAHELAEHATLQLGEELRQVVKLSEQQCAMVEHMAHAFDAGGGLSDTLTAAEHQVMAVEARFRAALAGHSVEVAKASGHARGIVKLAGSVAEIAQSARVLTFNARVESARLGEAGKGFVVIANAIRDLARDVQTSNELVTRLAGTLAQALPALERTATELSTHTETQLAGVRASLARVRGTFETEQSAALGQLDGTRSAAHALRDRSQAVVENLQFQDRASQLLMHAKAQLETLEALVGIEEQTAEHLDERAGEMGRTLGDGSAALAAGEVALF